MNGVRCQIHLLKMQKSIKNRGWRCILSHLPPAGTFYTTIYPPTQWVLHNNLIDISGLCAQYKCFWMIRFTKLNSSLVMSIKCLLCEAPLKNPQTILPAQLNLVRFSLLCGGKLFSSQMLKLEMFMEKPCFSNYTYTALLWASCNICLKVLVFPDVGYLSYVCAAGRLMGTVGASYKIHGSFMLFRGTKLGCRKHVYVWGICIY